MSAEQRSRRRYKRYLEDPELDVPRQTIARWEQEQSKGSDADDGHIVFDELHFEEMGAPGDGCSSQVEDGANSCTSPSEGCEDQPNDVDDEDFEGVVDNTEQKGDRMDDDSDGDLPSDIEDEEREDDIEQVVDEAVLPGGDDPIYPTAPITHSQSALAVMAYALRHSLSKVAVQDLLRLINIHLPEGSLPESMYLFTKNFSEYKDSIKFHVYCKDCYSYLGLSEELYCNICKQGCTRKSAIADGSYFVYTSLSSQLKDVMQNASLSQYFLHEDGHSRDVTLTWNSDGMPAFQSGNGSVWPIQCSIDLLPPDLKKKHILITGLWFGSSKPQFSAFLKPFVEEFRDLAEEGVSWCNPVSGNEYSCKVYAKTLTCDSVARCQLQGISQFNGYFGCSWCLHKGKRVARGNGHFMAYPYTENSSPPARTHKIIQDECVKLVSGQTPSYGVRSVSPLLLLPQFNMVSSFPVDYMHAVCEGVVEKMTNLWFDSSNHHEPWYVGKRIDEVDVRIASIVPPDDITRLPRSPSQRAHWKASEFRSWLLFYCLPVMFGILPNVYLTHVLLLVHAIWLLLQESVSRTDLCTSHIILTEFVKQMEILYGEANMTYNVHLMLHLSASVQRWGPLWKTSCFPFEGYNRTIKSLFHGTRYVPSQISQNFAISRLLTHKIDKMHPDTPLEIVSCVKDFLRGYSYAFRAQQFVCHTVKVITLGMPVNFQLTQDMSQKLSDLMTECVENMVVQRYAKIILNGRKFCVDGKAGRRNNSVVSYDGGCVGCIQDVLVVRVDNAMEVVFVIKQYRVQPSGLPMHRQTGANAGHIVRLLEYVRERIVLKTVKSKFVKCVTAIIEEENYCMYLPNSVELD